MTYYCPACDGTLEFVSNESYSNGGMFYLYKCNKCGRYEDRPEAEDEKDFAGYLKAQKAEYNCPK